MPEILDSLRFLPQPQIIAVDNNKDELDLIVKGLCSVGLPVLPLQYDMISGISVPQLMNKNQLRIVFLDLNLNDIEHISSQISTTAAPIIEVLKALSPLGPYIIAFWTKHGNYVKNVMKYIAKDETASPLSLPFNFTIIDKTPFLPSSGEHDLEVLKAKIIKALNDEKLFLSLLSWESGVKDAIALTLRKIVELISKPQDDGTSLKYQDVKDILQNLGKAAWGDKRAPQNPGRAVTHGLRPLLIDHLDSIVENQKYLAIWKVALAGGWSRKLPSGVTPSILNSHCLIDLNRHDENLRGNWFEFSEKARKKRTVWKRLFNTDLNTLLEEFINIDLKQLTIKKATEIRNSVKLGLLECTAACDFANGKAPLQRYILCAKIPSENGKYISWGEQPEERRLKHQAIHKIEIVAINGVDYILYLDFKYVLSLPLGHELLTSELSEIKFRIRNQVLIDIASKYASHTTRPGLFSFQSK